eukprot:3934058-Rhodomonas_salina.1
MLHSSAVTHTHHIKTSYIENATNMVNLLTMLAGLFVSMKQLYDAVRPQGAAEAETPQTIEQSKKQQRNSTKTKAATNEVDLLQFFEAEPNMPNASDAQLEQKTDKPATDNLGKASDDDDDENAEIVRKEISKAIDVLHLIKLYVTTQKVGEVGEVAIQKINALADTWRVTGQVAQGDTSTVVNALAPVRKFFSFNQNNELDKLLNDGLQLILTNAPRTSNGN